MREIEREKKKTECTNRIHRHIYQYIHSACLAPSLIKDDWNPHSPGEVCFDENKKDRCSGKEIREG